MINSNDDQKVLDRAEYMETVGGRIRELVIGYANTRLLMIWLVLVVLLAYVAGLFGIRLVFVIPLLTYLLWNILSMSYKREQIKYTSHLHNMYRFATMNTDFETADSINTALMRIWNVLEPVLSSKLIEALQPILGHVKFGQFVSDSSRQDITIMDVFKLSVGNFF